MAFLPYIPSRPLKIAGFSFFAAGILGISGLLIAYNYSGEVVATARLTEPISQTPTTMQAIEAYSQSLLQNTMNKMGVATVLTDKVVTMDVDFHPVRLTPDMGEVTLILDADISGVTQSNVGGWEKSFGKQTYQLKNTQTGEVAFQHEQTYDTFHADKDNIHAVIDHTNRDANITTKRGSNHTTIGRFTVKGEGDYVLTASLQKLEYSMPVSDLTLIVKKGMMAEPKVEWMLGLFGVIILGFVCLIITTPIDKRVKPKKK